MITFFQGDQSWFAVESRQPFSPTDQEKLIWLFGGANPSDLQEIKGTFIGPRKEMVTPWSTNAVEITQNMGIEGITRIEKLISEPVGRWAGEPVNFDPMLQQLYENPGQDLFHIDLEPEPVKFIEDISAYNKQEGLALSDEEIDYLKDLSIRIGRSLTDSEVFGFSQVNSEHCRHKIFNGTFIIDGKEMTESLFQLIKQTSKEHPNYLVSAYKDNVAFIEGPDMEQFAPDRQDVPDFFVINDVHSVISLKAETHNFPTTVEPFNGAATGSGGEIRDRMAGGKGSVPVAGTAVYMTSYPRLKRGERDSSMRGCGDSGIKGCEDARIQGSEDKGIQEKDCRIWEKAIPERPWLYQNPEEILIKASNGASDFGNKFGQPLICGSVLTFEHETPARSYGFDKVIMLAGGIGYARKEDAQKDVPQGDERVVVMGGDNYRIGMGGGAVSSVATGEYDNTIELNAVQRSNPEMQKRVFNVVRAMTETKQNPVISIHDHGAGGHLNSISELVEESGGTIHIDKLPVGDPTLSDREIISNESQERMGLIIKEEDLDLMRRVAERERAPIYTVGETTHDHNLVFEDARDGSRPIDLAVQDFFGKPPKTILTDTTEILVPLKGTKATASEDDQEIHGKGEKRDPLHQALASTAIPDLLDQVLRLEAVACKDWLTNKVDRAVSGKIAKQQTCGPIQLPLSNLGVTAIDYQGNKGMATSLGHAPVAGLIDPGAASRLAITEALTNLVWAPLTYGLKGVSLSANWMWPAKNPGENARLYAAVKAVSDFCIELGINVPTGKDSLSMTQKYPDGKVVFSPGTVIISAVAEVSDVKKVVGPDLASAEASTLIYIPFDKGPFRVGGSSAAQVLNQLGETVPEITDAQYVQKVFEQLQLLVSEDMILSGHDVSAGGLITTLLEMLFPVENLGMDLDLSELTQEPLTHLLFSEKPGVVIQVADPASVTRLFRQADVACYVIGKPIADRQLKIAFHSENLAFPVDPYRDRWFETSYLLDRNQCGDQLALERYTNYKVQPLKFRFPKDFTGTCKQFGINPKRRQPTGIRGAIIREKGVNRDRDMAWAMYLAGFDVKDVHMTDLISGRETLDDVHFIAFVGGFSNSDVLGSAKGWAGAFLYNAKAKETLDRFYARTDTLSLGVCNGCQLMVELGLLFQPEAMRDEPRAIPHAKPEAHNAKPTARNAQPKMAWNDSHKYECAFVGIDILENDSVMLQSLAGSKLGIWVAHGEGKFVFPEEEAQYHIPAKFSYSGYPGNPNGSMFDAACLASADGRHLAIMPHLEDSVLPWQWAWYPPDRRHDEVTPWIEAFVNARRWIANKLGKETE